MREILSLCREGKKYSTKLGQEKATRERRKRTKNELEGRGLSKESVVSENGNDDFRAD
jgi:hypothetical protein